MQQEFWKSIARLAMHQAFQKYKAPEVSIRLAPRAVIVNTCRIGCCIYACYRGHFGLRVKHFAVLLRVEQRSSGLRPPALHSSLCAAISTMPRRRWSLTLDQAKSQMTDLRRALAKMTTQMLAEKKKVTALRRTLAKVTIEKNREKRRAVEALVRFERRLKKIVESYKPEPRSNAVKTESPTM